MPHSVGVRLWFIIFFFSNPATPEIYTLSLHDALPICEHGAKLLLRSFGVSGGEFLTATSKVCDRRVNRGDRKSTRLNSSHRCISYAVFCLKKKKKKKLIKLHQR